MSRDFPLPQSREELIEQNRRIAVEKIKGASDAIAELQCRLTDARSLLNLPGVLDGSTAVQCFALFSGLRDALKQFDGLIGAEIDTPSSGRDAGRLHDIVLRHFEQTSTSQVKCEGRTVHLQNQLWASCLDVDALKRHPDTAEFVREKVNGQTLSAYVRELEKGDDGEVVLPEGLQDAIRVSETIQVRTRKG